MAYAGRGSLALRVVAAAAALAGAARAAGADESSISCDRGLVHVGDAKVDLMGKCGEPALREARQVAQGAFGVLAGATAAVVEEWTYNYGPQRFTMRVMLEGGKVVAIQRGGYGYDPALLRPTAGAGGRARCDSSALHVGDAKIDLLARCGEPATRDLRQEQRQVPVLGSNGSLPSLRTVQVEVWTYDFGPQYFMAFVTLEDGAVVSVERGGYGYAQ
jgi:hypothetical protein